MSAPPWIRPHDPGARILVLAPVGRDARLAARALGRAALPAHVCADLDALRREIAAGAGAVLLTDEALAAEGAADPEAWMGPEPPWSSLPVVVLTRRRTGSGAGLPALRGLAGRPKATFLQRPVARRTLVSVLRSALAARCRQYEVRDLLEELREGVRRRDGFLATLGHELRNPVAAIANGVTLLGLEKAGLGETGRFAVELMERQMRHLSRMLDDLLEVSRVARDKLELRCAVMDLRDAIHSGVAALAPQLEEKGQHLEVVLPPQPVWLEGDATRIEQIVWNLLGNAAKYTQPGGHVRLSLAVRGGEAGVEVADDGRGMTAAFLPHAFDPFAQADIGGGGLGLGLALSRRLAELHGGSLTAASGGPGKGSEFRLRLPLR